MKLGPLHNVVSRFLYLRFVSSANTTWVWIIFNVNSVWWGSARLVAPVLHESVSRLRIFYYLGANPQKKDPWTKKVRVSCSPIGRIRHQVDRDLRSLIPYTSFCLSVIRSSNFNVTWRIHTVPYASGYQKIPRVSNYKFLETILCMKEVFSTIHHLI